MLYIIKELLIAAFYGAIGGLLGAGVLYLFVWRKWLKESLKG